MITVDFRSEKVGPVAGLSSSASALGGRRVLWRICSVRKSSDSSVHLFDSVLVSTFCCLRLLENITSIVFPRSSLLSSRVRSRCCLVCVGIVCCCRPNVPRTACLQKTKRSVVTASPLLSQLLFSACSDVVAAVGLDQFITKSKSAESSSVLPVARPTY